MSGEDYIINPQILKQLHLEICEAAVRFFKNNESNPKSTQKLLID